MGLSTDEHLKEMTLLKIRFIFHAVAFCHHLFTWYLVETHIHDSIGEELADLYEFKYLFFSGWNFGFQFIYLIIALICDIVTLKEQCSSKVNISYNALLSARDYLFITFVFPFTMVVAACFWLIFKIDRELIMPSRWDLVVPYYLIHAFHTTILPIIFLEILIIPKYSPRNHKSGIFWIGAIVVSYFAIANFKYFMTGKWVYVIFKVVHWTQRIGLLLTIYISSVISYFIGCYINSLTPNLWTTNSMKNQRFISSFSNKKK